MGEHLARHEFKEMDRVEQVTKHEQPILNRRLMSVLPQKTTPSHELHSISLYYDGDVVIFVGAIEDTQTHTSCNNVSFTGPLTENCFTAYAQRLRDSKTYFAIQSPITRMDNKKSFEQYGLNGEHPAFAVLEQESLRKRFFIMKAKEH